MSTGSPEAVRPDLLRQLCNPPIELRDCLTKLLASSLMRRELELTLHFGPRQSTRFELARPLGIRRFRGLAGLLLFLFPFFHSLGEAGLRVDEPFSSITHTSGPSGLVEYESQQASGVVYRAATSARTATTSNKRSRRLYGSGLGNVHI